MSWLLALVLYWLWSALVWAQVLPFVGPGTPHTTGGGVTAPTFVTEGESAWTQTASATVDTPSTAVTNGDLLVAVMISEDVSNVGTLTASTASGSTSAWTQQQDQSTASNCRVTLSTATATATGNVTGRVTRSVTATSKYFGINMLVFRNHGGVGASSKTNGSGAPSLNLTTTLANSAIVVGNGDWSAQDGTTRTWRANAGAATEVTYFRSSINYAAYAAYHANAGAVGTYAVGLTLPIGQTFAIAALEVKGL